MACRVASTAEDKDIVKDTVKQAEEIDLTGEWTSADKTVFCMLSKTSGLLGNTSNNPTSFSLLSSAAPDGMALDGWHGQYNNDSIRWHSWELGFKDGQLVKMDRRKELTWHRLGSW